MRDVRLSRPLTIQVPVPERRGHAGDFMKKAPAHPLVSALARQALRSVAGDISHVVNTKLESIVEGGAQVAVTALSEVLQRRIRTDGPEYLDRAEEQAHAALQTLVSWGKRNPVKSAAAATALAGIAAFGMAYVQRSSRTATRRTKGSRRHR